MDLVKLHRRSVEGFDARVNAIPDDRWDAPTACAEWNVRALVNHIVNETLWTPELLSGKTVEEVGDRFDGDGGIVKLSAVYPDNPARGAPTIQSAVVVFSDRGAPVALLDGAWITQLRTGAASALASIYLSRPESRRLVIVGSGALAPFMAAAHCAVRPIHASPCEHIAQADDAVSNPFEEDMLIWRNPEEHGNFVGFRQYRRQLELAT